MACDITNGDRFEAYAIVGKRGSGAVALQGAARHSAEGNCVIIKSFEVTGQRSNAQMKLVDRDNLFV